jgi:type II secretory pathway pseudopilin PulG
MKRQTKLMSPSPPTQSGFTIVEALLAIILVTVLMVAIAPVIALSVATRVQARRVEQATQAARTYIDGVRSGQIETPAARVPMTETATDPSSGQKIYVYKRDKFAEVKAPANTPLNCPKPAVLLQNSRYPYCLNQPGVTPTGISLYCADFDGNGCSSGSSKDFIIQAFRSVIPLSGDTGSQGYLLGVRVYRANAFDGVGTLQTTLEKGGKKVATYTGGTGERYAPIVEMTTEVRGKSTDFNSFCTRLGGEGCP